MTRRSVIRDFRIFVHIRTDTVAYIFPKDSISVRFHVAFHRMTDVTYCVAYYGLLDARKRAPSVALMSWRFFLFVCPTGTVIQESPM